MDQIPPSGLAGPIRPLPRAQHFSHADQRLATAWIDQRSQRSAPRSRSVEDLLGGATAERALPEDAPGPGDGPLLVMASRPDSPALAAALPWAADGARTYLLVGADWPVKQAPRLLTSAPRVLLRRVRHANACAVWHSEGAWIWLGEQRTWWLALDVDQAEALRLSLVRQFWHEATEEGVLVDGAFALQKAGDRPFEVPEVSADAPCRRVESQARFAVPTGASVQVHVPDGGGFAGPLGRLSRPASGRDQVRLAELVNQGTRVQWDDLDLPQFWIRPGLDGALRCPHTAAPLHLDLNADQSRAFAAVLAQPTRWRFETQVRIGDHQPDQHRFWLPDAASSKPLVAEEALQAGTLQAVRLRALPDTHPNPWPKPGVLALSSRVHWTAAPPILPKGCAPDPLAGQWQQLDQLQAQRVTNLRQGLADADQEHTRIGNKFKRLAGALLGLGRKKARLNEELEGCAAPAASARGPGGARLLFEALTSLEQLQQAHRKALRDEEHAARTEEAREEQTAAWQKRLEKARIDASAARQQRTSHLATQAQLAETLASATARQTEMEAQRAPLDAEIRRIDPLVSALKRELASLSASNAASAQGKPGKNQSRLAPKPTPSVATPESEAAAAALQAVAAEAEARHAQRLDEIAALEAQLEVLRAEVRALAKPLSDVVALLRRTQDDLGLTERNLKRIESELAAHDTKANEPFDFKPPMPLAIPVKAGTGANFVPQVGAATTAPKVPDEAPPRLGSLHRLADKRWLCIENWSQLDDGEAEASRLNATLVAKATP